MNNASNNKRFILFLFFSFLLWTLVFLFTFFSPMMADNFLFSRIVTPNFADIMSGEKIRQLQSMSLEGAFFQASTMYQTWCGRFLGNFLVYCAFLLSPIPLALLSSFLFLVLCFLLHVHLYGKEFKEHLNAWSLWLFAALIWVTVPSFGSAFLWVSVGGLLALLGQLVFLLPYRLAFESASERIVSPWYLGFFLFVAGIAATSLDYASCAALPPASLAALLLLRFLGRAKQYFFSLLFGVLGASLGAAITLLAPGNAFRMQRSLDPEVHEWLGLTFLERVGTYLAHLPGVFFLHWLPFCLLFWACWVLRKKRVSFFQLPEAVFVYVIAFAATLAAYFFTPWPPARAFATTSVTL
ncbi:MAG: hypothetical protein J5803_03350, partial [Desulfovibrio sp.]|nr:hypothetical protein [Desulfovibrio sp.]